MLNSVIIKKYWESLEKSKAAPTFVTKINTIDFKKVKAALDSKNTIYIKSLLTKMYNGEAFILRNAAKKKLKNIYSMKFFIQGKK